MNIPNVDKAIAILKRAQYFTPLDFQALGPNQCFCETEDELNEAGIAANLAGLVAVSSEFHEDGGWSNAGVPQICALEGHTLTCSEAIGQWLDITQHFSQALINGGKEHPIERTLYGKPLAEVTAADVIEKLQWLKNNFAHERFEGSWV